MPTTRSIAFALAGWLCWAAQIPARAAETTAGSLTLEQARETALRLNPDLQAARETLAGFGARADGVRGQRWPSVTLSAGGLRTDNPAQVFGAKLNAGELAAADFALSSLNNPSPLTQWTAAITVTAPIDVFGKVKAATSASDAAAEAASAALDETRADLLLRVEQAYRRAALAEATMASTEQAIVAARARESDVAAAVTQGAALEADLLRARSRRRLREADLAERRLERDDALAQLQRLMGGDDSRTPLDAGGFERPAGAPALEGSEDLWVERALTERASLRATQAEVRAAAGAAEAAARERRPDLGVFGTVANDRLSGSPGATSATVGASLRWGAFDRTRAARIDEAEAARRAAEQAAAAAKAQVRMEVSSAYRQASTARERWHAAAGGAEESAEALRVIRERRAAGVATLSDELAVEAEALAAQLDEQRSLADVALADAALRRASGTP